MAKPKAELDEVELRLIVEKLARAGNMPACRFLYETWIKPQAPEGVKDGADPLAEVDDLARRRSARGA